MEEKQKNLELQQNELYTLRNEIGLNRKEFALEYGIPLRTIEDWEHGKRKMPEYLLRLLAYKVKMDALSRSEAKAEEGKEEIRNVNIIVDTDGRKIVLINDVRFKENIEKNGKKLKSILQSILDSVMK